MESIDRLREFWLGRFPVMDRGLHEEFSDLLDAIEQEHKQTLHDAICRAHADGERNALRQERSASEDYRRGYDDGYVKAMGKVGDECIKLPVDADGVPIRVGDVMEVGNGRLDEVRFLTLNGNGWAFNEKGWVPNWSHHHTLTVKDVLVAYASRILIAGCIDEEDELVAEYAAKLRLAGDGE